MSKLLIVESPAKAKTIKKYLGDDFEVLASNGHIRDLPKSSLGVNVEKDFKPQYLNITGKEKLIKELKKVASNSTEVFLATDPDREGEAISWHLAYLLNLDDKQENRVTFEEITKKGVEKGMQNPRPINISLVDSQQARRILDRIVGYKLSPFLWKKVKRGLSAGRVQSVAVKLLADRENEINAFNPVEYWTVDAILKIGGTAKTVTAKLRGKGNVTGEEFKIENEQQCNAILEDLKDTSFEIANIKTGSRKKSPEPPFITSTLQQDASRKLGFVARRTMRAAQELYEGIDIEGLGSVGLITYMRTDSLRISNDAHDAAIEYIENRFGEKFAHKTPRTYKQKNAANVQDAHEAIRPTMVELTPEQAQKSLSTDQYKIYKLIWERFVASRMSDQQQKTHTVDIDSGDYKFRASGYEIVFEGFTVLYEVSTEEKEQGPTVFPEIDQQTALKKKELKPLQHFTQPPQRFSEATLIKALEENGIGRPSTYAPIISTIIDRGYVERKQKNLIPTTLGMVITDLMKQQFPDIVDVKFSASMEKNLDKIEEGKSEWVKIIEKFYKEFDKSLKKAEQNLEGQRIKIPYEETDVICENCGKNMVIKTGRFGKFLACPGYPDCKTTKKIVVETKGNCPKCDAKIVGRKSTKGRQYFACEKGMSCGYMTWDEPAGENCPKCSKSLLKKKGKSPYLYCSNEQCDYKKAVEK